MANRAYLRIFDEMESICPGVNYVTILQVLTDEGIVNTGEMSALEWRHMMTERFELAKPEPTVIQLWNDRFIKLLDQRGPEGDVVSLCLDITATVTNEAQLKKARATAESANRAKSAFLANMSHEIRTPMNGVIGMADLLSESNLNDDQRLYVDTIKNSGEALLVIINDVLDFSKIDAKKLQLHPEAFDLERAALEVLMLLQPSAGAKGLSLSLDYDLFMPNMLVSDPGRIRQILTNLVGNAVKFTSEGHVLVRVTGVPDAESKKLMVHITIEDTGIGIPADMVALIFGEFNQVENERNRQFDGTGLGLAISQRLIDMMGGELWVTSKEGVGSCFGIRLEMGMTETIDTLSWRAPPGLHHVIIVDPAEVNRRILERHLAQLNIKVTCCCKSAESKIAIDPSIDLVIAAESEAEDLLNYLAAENPTLPVVILSPDIDKVSAEIVANYPEIVQGTLQDPPLRKDLFDILNEIKIDPSHSMSDVPSVRSLRLMRVLAAEDNKTNQLVFCKMVKDLNIDLTFAANGEEAVTLFQQIAPDLIFMDISMPMIDGKEATAAIRAMEQDHHTPIVALTAHAMEGDDQEILAAGLDKYLTKPLRKSEIIEVIHAAHDEEMEPL